MAVTYVPRDVASGQIPDGIIMNVPTTNLQLLKTLAGNAAESARAGAPKSSGKAAEGIEAIFGPGWFGIRWSHPYLWYQDQGTGPHTMRALRGKTIPMWVDDDGGSQTAKIPAKDRLKRARVTKDGRRQILIFRKATKPGAPGRIGKRTRGPDGRIAKGNVGVKWRHPGLPHKGFLSAAVVDSASAVRGISAHGDARAVSLRAR